MKNSLYLQEKKNSMVQDVFYKNLANFSEYKHINSLPL